MSSLPIADLASMNVAQSGKLPAPPALSKGAALVLITGFFMLLPLSTDLYQPALPQLSSYFHTPVSMVQLTMSLYALIFAVCQFVFGPLSDRYGRLPIGYFSALSYTCGTLICTFAPSIYWLIGGRILQGMGVCSGQVCLRAMTRDLYTPQEGGHVLAKAGLFMASVPLLGPIAAGVLIRHFESWRAVFVFLSMLSMVMVVLVAVLMKETNQQLRPGATRLGPMLAAYRQVLKTPTFIAYMLCSVFGYGGLFAFLSGASFVFVRVLGVDVPTYGVYFSIVMVGNVLGAYVSRRLIPILGLHGTMRVVGVIMPLAGLTLCGLALAGVHHVIALIVPMWFYCFCYGLSNPCFQAGAVAPFPDKAGSAAAMLGFLTMAAASLFGLWIGASYNGTVVPLAATVCVASLLAGFSSLVLVQRYGKV